MTYDIVSSFEPSVDVLSSIFNDNIATITHHFLHPSGGASDVRGDRWFAYVPMIVPLVATPGTLR